MAQSAYEAEQAAAYFAGRCRSNLRVRVGEDAPITVETLAHGDGSFSVNAFHTVWCEDTNQKFAREVVLYKSYDTGSGPFDQFVHGVEFYPDGNHDEWTFYELDRFEE
jgi:hypothetical protein